MSEEKIKPIRILEMTPEQVDSLSASALRDAVKSVIRSGGNPSEQDEPASHRNHQSHLNEIGT